jgi:hypothetical protein
LGANGRQRCPPPCARPSRGVHAQCHRAHTPSSTRYEPRALGRKQPATIAATAARPTRAVGAHRPRGHTPSRRRDAAEALWRKQPAKIAASAARLTRAVGAHGPRGRTPPRRRDGAVVLGRKQLAKISASAARLTRAVGAQCARGRTPPRSRDGAELLGRKRPAKISASAARLARAVGAHGPRGHTPPRRRDGAGALVRKQPAKMSTPLRPPHSRCARTVPSRSYTVKHAGRATVTSAQTAGEDVNPPSPAQLKVCVRSALEVAHRALSLPGASASTASTQPPSPSAPPLRAPATYLPHSTAGASDGIDPAGGSTGAAQADGDVTHATIPRAGVCSCATATAPLGRRERWCGAAGVGDGARSGTQ